MALNMFERRRTGKFMAVCAGIASLLSLASLAFSARSAADWGYAFVPIALAFIAWRSWRSCTVIQETDQLRVWESGWTRRLARNRVIRFSVESGRTWPRFQSGFFLVAELNDGTLRQFKEFSEPLGATGERSLEAVAAALNSAWDLGS